MCEFQYHLGGAQYSDTGWTIKDGVSEKNGRKGDIKGVRDYTPRAYESEQNVPLSTQNPSQNVW